MSGGTGSDVAPSRIPEPPQLHSFADGTALAHALAEYVLYAQDEALKKSETFKIALSGGSLPKVLGGLVGEERAKWDAWEVFFADERLVPLSDPESNYRACHEHLFSKVSIPREQIHTVDETQLDNPEEAADQYEKQLIGAFVGKNAVAWPRFDLILLGVGPDGHTCSLFPGHALLDEEDAWVASLTDSPKPPSSRITLTFPVLNHAHRVAFVASGEGKQEILHQIMDKPEDNLPCSKVRVIPPGVVRFFSDDAATKLVNHAKAEFKL